MGAVTGIFEYTTEQVSKGTPMSYVALGILGVFAYLIIWHLLHGLRRGIFRQIAHTAIMLLAAVVAFFGTKMFCNELFSVLEGTTVEELLAQAGASGMDQATLDILNSIDITTLEYILALPLGVIVTPLIFMLAFAVLNVLFRIIYIIVTRVAHISKGGGAVRRLTGLLLGACEGLIIAAIIFLPFAALTGAADQVMSAVVDGDDEGNAAGEQGAGDTADSGESFDLEEVYTEYLEPLVAHPAFQISRTIGGEFVLDSLATFELGDNKINVRTEFGGIMKLLLVDAATLGEADFNNLSAENKDAINAIVNYVDSSDYMATIITGVLNVMTDILEDQMADSGANSGEGIDFVTPMFEIFKGIKADEVGSVLETFKEFYFLISDEGVLAAISSGDQEDLAEMFAKTDANGKSVLTRAMSILNGNTRTSVLVTTLTEMTFAMMLEDSEMGEEVKEIYNDVKTEVNTIVSSIDTTKPREEQVADVTESLNSALVTNDIEIEEEIVTEIADYIVENYAGQESITEAEFNEAMLQYYDAYLKYQEENQGGEGGEGNVGGEGAVTE